MKKLYYFTVLMGLTFGSCEQPILHSADHNSRDFTHYYQKEISSAETHRASLAAPVDFISDSLSEHTLFSVVEESEIH
ncbi:MAG: hypothetical protein Q4F57_04235 [Weeksellaceae bacterium]|nr:hypothetical protein [Weeksellaceae bacterium]